VESAPLLFALSKEESNPPGLGWGIILFRHFHGPIVDGRNCSNSLRLARYMRWAASVSL
jgi:hypothetical protein